MLAHLVNVLLSGLWSLLLTMDIDCGMLVVVPVMLVREHILCELREQLYVISCEHCLCRWYSDSVANVVCVIAHSHITCKLCLGVCGSVIG